MEITYEMTPEDVAAFAKHLSRARWRKPQTWAVFIAVWVGTGLLLASRWANGAGIASEFPMAILLAGVYWIVVVFAVRAWSSFSTRRGYLKDPWWSDRPRHGRH